MRMFSRFGACAILFTLSALAQGTAPRVVAVSIDGEISPITVEIVGNAIEQAQRENAAMLLVRIFVDVIDSRRVEYPIAEVLQYSEGRDYVIFTLKHPPRVTPLQVATGESTSQAIYFTGWRVNGWVKQGILLGFRMGGIVDMSAGLPFFDKSTYPVHAFETEAALAVEEVGDMGLLEPRLLGQPEAGEIAFLDTLPKSIAEIVLQNSEFHAGSIAWIIAMRYFKNDFHS